MFENTRLAIDKTKRDLKALAFCSTLVIQLIFIIYHIFSMIIDRGIIVVHTILLGFSAVYLLTYILTHDLSKLQRKRVKLAFKVSKYIINLASLVISLVWLANNPDGLTVITIVPVVALLLSILIQFICEFLSFIFSKYSEMYVSAIDADTKLIQDAYDFANRNKESIAKVKDFYDRHADDVKMVKEFYDEHKDGIKKAVSTTGRIINTLSALRKPRKTPPPLEYEDKTEEKSHAYGEK